MSEKHRSAGELAGTFMMHGRVTCVSPEEYESFIGWTQERDVPVEVDIDADTGNVTFSTASDETPVPDRDLELLKQLFFDVGSVLLQPDEYPEFAAWAREQNVPFHQQVDANTQRIVVMRRGWGTVEMG